MNNIDFNTGTDDYYNLKINASVNLIERRNKVSCKESSKYRKVDYRV